MCFYITDKRDIYMCREAPGPGLALAVKYNRQKSKSINISKKLIEKLRQESKTQKAVFHEENWLY